MYLQTNKIGGYFTLLFYVTALMLIIASLIYFVVDNIEETKALVPLVSV